MGTSIIDAKLEALTAATTVRLYGHPLDHPESNSERRKWQALRPCFCIDQRDGDRGCSCPKTQVLWLPPDPIVADGRTGQKDHDGNEIRYYDLSLDAQTVLESMHAVSARTLQEHGEVAGVLGTADDDLLLTVIAKKSAKASGVRRVVRILWGLLDGRLFTEEELAKLKKAVEDSEKNKKQ